MSQVLQVLTEMTPDEVYECVRTGDFKLSDFELWFRVQQDKAFHRGCASAMGLRVEE